MQIHDSKMSNVKHEENMLIREVKKRDLYKYTNTKTLVQANYCAIYGLFSAGV